MAGFRHRIIVEEYLRSGRKRAGCVRIRPHTVLTDITIVEIREQENSSDPITAVNLSRDKAEELALALLISVKNFDEEANAEV